MIYNNLFAKAGKTKIRAGLIGTGTYGISLLAQALLIPRLEIADVLSREDDGGILKNTGVIDLVTCLRREDEAGLGGGVFLVFSCKQDDAWEFVKDKGLLTNPSSGNFSIFIS